MPKWGCLVATHSERLGAGRSTSDESAERRAQHAPSVCEVQGVSLTEAEGPHA